MYTCTESIITGSAFIVRAMILSLHTIFLKHFLLCFYAPLFLRPPEPFHHGIMHFAQIIIIEIFFCKEDLFFLKTNVRLTSFYMFYNFPPDDGLLDWNMQRNVKKDFDLY